jgi:ATPase subunit of ABC transporter with duplicated ATPase domains
MVARTLARWNGAALVVSHDRLLLAGMGRILGLRVDGTAVYALFHEQAAFERAHRKGASGLEDKENAAYTEGESYAGPDCRRSGNPRSHG